MNYCRIVTISLGFDRQFVYVDMSQNQRNVELNKKDIPPSSFVNSTQLNDILPSLSVECLYRTYSTLLVSPGLTPWLVHPWDLLTLHQGTEPSTSEVLRRWIVHERQSTRPLFQIYTTRN